MSTLEASPPPDLRWFSRWGCVVERHGVVEVRVGGALIGRFRRDDEDRAQRYVLLVTLARDPTVHIGRLAAAFGVTREWLRQLRLKAEAGGTTAVVLPPMGGHFKLGPEHRRHARTLFAQGLTSTEVHRRLRGAIEVSFSTISRERMRWLSERANTARTAAPSAPVPAAPARVDGVIRSLGAWLLMAIADQHWLYHAISTCGASDERARVAIDTLLAAVVCEGSPGDADDSLEAPSAPALLRTARVPTTADVRRQLRRLADDGGARLLSTLAAHYIAAGRASCKRAATFYVEHDEGRHDFVVRDADRRLWFQTPQTSSQSISSSLLLIARRLRAGLTDSEEILLVLPRDPDVDQLVALRDAGVECVALDARRKDAPRELPFDRIITVHGATYAAREGHVTLSGGRGRLRRIVLRDPHNTRINIIASSTQSAESLVTAVFDDVDQVTPGTRSSRASAFAQRDRPSFLLERALRAALAEERATRRAIDAGVEADTSRELLERQLAELTRRRTELEILSPSIEDAPTETRGTFTAAYLADPALRPLVDTLRLVHANVIADLAALLGPHLNRPANAKAMVESLLAAPGHIHVAPNEMQVVLAPVPAFTPSERAAIDHLLAVASRWNLSLAGSESRRPLRFALESPT